MLHAILFSLLFTYSQNATRLVLHNNYCDCLILCISMTSTEHVLKEYILLLQDAKKNI